MKRKMSPKVERRDANNGLTNSEDESDSNIMKYNTSTPLKKTSLNRIRRESNAPDFDSEESGDAVIKAQRKKPKRLKSARSLKQERIHSAKITNREESRKRKSKRRRSEEGRNHLQEDRDGDDSDDFERLRKEKNFRKQGREETGELPIAELLRKAQENQKSQQQTRYEDPIPMPELTTDTLYVQGRNGFSAVKIGNIRSERSPSERSIRPIHVAIRIHDLSKTVMIFCQGLLGGIALSQVIMTMKMDSDYNFRGQIDSVNYSQFMSGVFLFLATMSLLAAMDRIDLANLDLEHLREIFSNRWMMLVTFPLYIVALCIHLSDMKIGFENVELTSPGQESGQPTDQLPLEEDDKVEMGQEGYRQNRLWKFSLCIIAWFFIAVGPNDDFTTTNLEDMQKYAN